jgi:hypothetical protein
MSGAEKLRAAAARMRAAAEDATKGPWRRAADDDLGSAYPPNFIANWSGEHLQGVAAFGDGDQADRDSRWTCLAHPGLAGPLPDLLDAIADFIDEAGTGHCADPDCYACRIVRHALAVGDTLAGEETPSEDARPPADPMRYVLIDNDGELHVKTGNWRADVNSRPGRVTLPTLGARGGWAGWVDDDSHPLGLPLNMVGGLVLTGVGAAVMPYAGPVVITGWDVHGQPSEVCGLDDDQIREIRDCHYDARAALDGQSGLLYDNAREVAEQMRTAPTPTVQVLSADEFFARTRGRS